LGNYSHPYPGPSPNTNGGGELIEKTGYAGAKHLAYPVFYTLFSSSLEKECEY
jgi:hypothetical protein